jgi:hypothetical protein
VPPAVGDAGAGDSDFWNKLDALEKIAKHLGMLRDRVDVTSGDQPVRFTLQLGDGDSPND